MEKLKDAINLFNQGKVREAEKAFLRLAKEDPQNFQPYFYLAIISKAKRDLQKAFEFANKSVSLNPKFVDGYNFLGGISYESGDIDKAVTYFEKALSLNPNYLPAWNNLGLCYKAKRNFEQAKFCFEKVVSLDSNYADAWNNLGTLLKGIGKKKEALNCFKKALEKNPQFLEAKLNLGLSFCEEGKVEEGIKLLQECYKAHPRNPKVLHSLASVLIERKRFDEAEKLLRQALSIAPNFIDARKNLVRLLYLKGCMKEVLEEMKVVFTLKGVNKSVDYFSLGNTFAALGKKDEAFDCYIKALELAPDYIPVYRQISLIHRFKQGDKLCNKFFDLEKRLNRTTRVDFKIEGYFALYKFYEDLGDYKKAFSYLKQGCDLKRTLFNFSIEVIERNTEKVMKIFTEKVVELSKGYGCPSKVPVFILGMPRSGTTLVEQILASHPDVHGGGELLFFINDCVKGLRIGNLVFENPQNGKFLDAPYGFFEVGWRYLQKIRPLNYEALRITDKTPTNFFLLGVIALSLPEAKIIHVKRNAMDTCFSCYRTLFVDDHEWSYNLEELGRFYLLYERIMEHWRKLFNGCFLEVQYEDLVDNFEKEAKRIIKYCELEWHPDCAKFWKTKRSVATASMMQVRQPIYKTSIGRWKKYEKFLEPLIKILEPIL